MNDVAFVKPVGGLEQCVSILSTWSRAQPPHLAAGLVLPA